MTVIKNIIFDFGGIFIDVDYLKTEQAFISAGIPGFSELYSQQSASPLFADFETGRVDVPGFFEKLRGIAGVSLSDEQITACWNRMLGRFYPEAIEKARSLRSGYRLFVFSNTNQIHYDRFMQIYREQFGRDDFEALFEKVYYSHTCGVRKPAPSAFEWVLRDAGIAAAETLFIDDTWPNIEGARQAGLQTVFLDRGMKMWEVI